MRKDLTKKQIKENISSLFDYFVKNVTHIIANSRDEGIQIQFNNLKHFLHKDVRLDLTDEDIIDLICQHFITWPIVEMVFSESEAYKEHPVSLSLKQITSTFKRHGIGSVARLQPYYDGIKERCKSHTTYQEKQVLLNDIFEDLFKNQLPYFMQKYGIAYTPPEVVNFVIQSTEDLCQKHFGKSLGDSGVNIMDPFTGTGTFITHLIDSGIISDEQLKKKYENGEIQCNEITLIAWYIASLNIEYLFHEKTNSRDYIPFEGIHCVDTFTT